MESSRAREGKKKHLVIKIRQESVEIMEIVKVLACVGLMHKLHGISTKLTTVQHKSQIILFKSSSCQMMLRLGE